ncbi:hypothetical protein, partial [Algibacter sp.]|uniref:hypothetical protein n=1 Tax=Algibacter sp. TaxID=1872428 RepID=UPI003C77E734
DNLKRTLPFFRMDIRSLINLANTFKAINKKAKHLGPLNIIKHTIAGIYNVNKIHVYQTKPSFKQVSLNENKMVNKDQYEHLMTYTKFCPWHTRRDLLKEALTNFVKGESLFSATENNELAWLCWLAESQNNISIKGFSKKIDLETNANILYDFYCREKNSFCKYLETSLSKIEVDDLPLYLVLNASNAIPDDRLRSWDLSLTKTISRHQILWFFQFTRVKRPA